MAASPVEGMPGRREGVKATDFAILLLFGKRKQEQGMCWICRHLLGLVIQMLVCAWATAALWPWGIAAWSPWVPGCWQILCSMALSHPSLKVLCWCAFSWWPVAQMSPTDLVLVTLQHGRPSWSDAGCCKATGLREAQGCGGSVDVSCPEVPAAIAKQNPPVSCSDGSLWGTGSLHAHAVLALLAIDFYH